jgi:hypothetical protein
MNNFTDAKEAALTVQMIRSAVEEIVREAKLGKKGSIMRMESLCKAAQGSMADLEGYLYKLDEKMRKEIDQAHLIENQERAHPTFIPGYPMPTESHAVHMHIAQATIHVGGK